MQTSTQANGVSPVTNQLSSPCAAGQGRRILFVNTDADFRAVVTRVLQHEGFRVQAAAHSGHALLLCRTMVFDAVVSELCGPDISGPSLVEQMRRHQPDDRGRLSRNSRLARGRRKSSRPARSRRTTWSNGSSTCCPALPPSGAPSHRSSKKKAPGIPAPFPLCSRDSGSGLGKSPARFERSEPRVPSPDRTYFFGRRKIESSGTALNSTVVIVHCSSVLPPAVWVTVWGIMIPSTCL